MSKQGIVNSGGNDDEWKCCAIVENEYIRLVEGIWNIKGNWTRTSAVRWSTEWICSAEIL